LIALVIGHKSTSPGRENARRNLTEFEFNTRLAVSVWKHAQVVGSVDLVLVWRRTWATLAADINAIRPQVSAVVSMHANGFRDPEVSGTEVLYYHRSTDGKRMAEIFQQHFVEALGLPDRGILPVDSEGRGARLLKETEAPAVMCEPFFMSNDDDVETALADDSRALADAYLKGLRDVQTLV
jgi:N-acetylmuramoyl-L-alanine amidase